jgi:hypothetical protein
MMVATANKYTRGPRTLNTADYYRDIEAPDQQKTLAAVPSSSYVNMYRVFRY